jgi:hypothetical protein
MGFAKPKIESALPIKQGQLLIHNPDKTIFY